MKESILDRLVCPIHKCSLELEALESDGAEVLSGYLKSKADENLSYPIIGGVPRMLPPKLQSGLREDYPEFFQKFEKNPSAAEDISDDDAKVQRHTQEAFGYEWTWAGDYDAKNFADWLPDGYTSEQLFSDRVGLEVGCGAGRHAENTSKFSKEHFAVDLSRAVDSAFPRLRNTANCHVVQADAFNLPFAERSFDYVYCLGVLQHMHSPPDGFQHLAKHPKAGGVLLVNVYQAGRPLTVGGLELFRKLTTNMSNENLRRLSVACGYIDWCFIWPWKVMKDSAIGSMLKPIVPSRIDEYAKHSFHTCIVDWFDRLSCPVKIHYKREDLQRWYTEEGYNEVVVTPYWKAFWNGYGVKD